VQRYKRRFKSVPAPLGIALQHRRRHKDGVEIGAPLWHTFSLEWAGYSIKAASEQAGVSIQISLSGSYIYINKYGKRFMNELKSMVHT
jgi:hypothetical protein